MNARQKAKRMKRELAEYESLLTIWRTKAFFYKWEDDKYRNYFDSIRIEKLQSVKLIDERLITFRVPEEVRKKELARELADALIKNDFINYEKDPEGTDKVRTEKAWVEVVRRLDPVVRKEWKDIEGTNEHL